MKNLKKIAISLTSLVMIFSPVANADTKTLSTFRVECESINYNDEICQLPEGVVSIKRTKTFSDASCTENEGWIADIANNRIIARNGCRARFDVGLNRATNIQTFSCNSKGSAYKDCFVFNNKVSPVWVYDRKSNAKCNKHNNWGEFEVYNGTKVWVDNGCQATFAVEVTY